MARKQSLAEGLALGAVSTAISETFGHPLSRVQILLQTQSENLRKGRLSHNYRGPVDCVVRTFRTEGFLSFWRGNMAAILYRFPQHVLQYAFRDAAKKLPGAQPLPTDSMAVKTGRNLLAGGMAGVMTASVVYSMTYAHTRLAADVKANPEAERQFKGIIDVYRKTFQSDGIRGLYRGFLISFLGIFVYRAAYFGLYDTLNPLIAGPNPSVLRSFLVGFGVTLLAGVLAYPFDTVRQRMLMRSAEEVKYKGAVDCASYILKNEGFLFFYKGITVSIARGLLGVSVLVMYDCLQQYLSKQK